MRNSLAILAVCLSANSALGHVSIAPNTAQPGMRVVVNFRIGHGCGAAAPISTALRVEIPPTVKAPEATAPAGWEITLMRTGNRISAVTWKGGEVKEGQITLFPLAFVAPTGEDSLAFPAVQFCGDQKSEWVELPRGREKLAHPAPLLTLAASGGVPAQAVSALSLKDGWFRALPGNLPAGGYFTLRNGGTQKAVLTGAESPACGMLMMHQSSGNGGMASMAHVSSLNVPAGDSIRFAPNGYNLMCMGPKSAMKPGSRVPVTLAFQDGDKLTATFEVRNAAGK